MNDDTKHTPGGSQADSEADKRIKEAQKAGAGNAGSATPKGHPSDDRHTTEHEVGALAERWLTKTNAAVPGSHRLPDVSREGTIRLRQENAEPFRSVRTAQRGPGLARERDKETLSFKPPHETLTFVTVHQSGDDTPKLISSGVCALAVDDQPKSESTAVVKPQNHLIGTAARLEEEIKIQQAAIR